MVLTVLSWKDNFGVTYYIPDGAQKRIEWADYSYHPRGMRDVRPHLPPREWE